MVKEIERLRVRSTTIEQQRESWNGQRGAPSRRSARGVSAVTF
jgi:hypothetical protein